MYIPIGYCGYNKVGYRGKNKLKAKENRYGEIVGLIINDDIFNKQGKKEYYHTNYPGDE